MKKAWFLSFSHTENWEKWTKWVEIWGHFGNGQSRCLSICLSLLVTSQCKCLLLLTCLQTSFIVLPATEQSLFRSASQTSTETLGDPLLAAKTSNPMAPNASTITGCLQGQHQRHRLLYRHSFHLEVPHSLLRLLCPRSPLLVHYLLHWCQYLSEDTTVHLPLLPSFLPPPTVPDTSPHTND